MSEVEGFKIVPHPRRNAEEWIELLIAGKRQEAAAHFAEEARRSRSAMNAAIDARLRELASSRD